MTIERYQLVKPYLDKYNRRISVLDIGAGISPVVSQQISMNHDAVVVMIEKDEIQIPSREFWPSTMWLKHRFSLDDLKRLQESEYFDVVIAFNFLHHMSVAEYPDAIRCVAAMGREVFIQVPSMDEPPQVPGFGEVIKGLNNICQQWGTQIGSTVQFPLHPPRPIYYINNRSTLRRLTRTSIMADAGSAETLIESTDTYLTGQIKGKAIKSWIPGINLWSFCNLGGKWPEHDEIMEVLRKFPLPSSRHGDITPWNFILDGRDLYLVDGFEGWMFDDKHGLEETCRLVSKSLSVLT